MIAARKAGKPPAAAWQRVEKDLEIDRTLRGFAAAGVAVTYHACDVSDRAALAEVARADPPGRRPDRGNFARSRRRALVPVREENSATSCVPTIRAKVDGAANLMALTRRDPIRHFIVFGSISGRLGGFGQVDYSLANEMACKLLGSYRRGRALGAGRRLPLACLGRSRHGRPARDQKHLAGNGALALMPLAEGLAHLVRELAAGTPEPEVMITERHHWERFAAGLGTAGRGSSRANGAGRACRHVLPLLTDVRRDAARRRSARSTFDPAADRFLIEHRLRGKPLLPVVVGLEALAEAARAASGQRVVGFRDIDMVDGLLFHARATGRGQACATRSCRWHASTAG